MMGGRGRPRAAPDAACARTYLLLARLSMMVTCHPAATSCTTVCDPMYPVPPVTRMLREPAGAPAAATAAAAMVARRDVRVGLRRVGGIAGVCGLELVGATASPPAKTHPPQVGPRSCVWRVGARECR